MFRLGGKKLSRRGFVEDNSRRDQALVATGCSAICSLAVEPYNKAIPGERHASDTP